ncbi:hypothetical protein SZN_36889 [Streptomyces zinciresistens K42]|uniref:Uncharacterized protein n=1 Tax=Streptomyces zinciresistens K42 TaxID=700597 RepID=G2GPC0_9ACTN|nr:hypothetical protein [Streptomyces zinciresistens]EGX54647.1 hypothetical protein SZN_36889 [Streptomyces zinciresistens K42]
MYVGSVRLPSAAWTVRTRSSSPASSGEPSGRVHRDWADPGRPHR